MKYLPVIISLITALSIGCLTQKHYLKKITYNMSNVANTDIMKDWKIIQKNKDDNKSFDIEKMSVTIFNAKRGMLLFFKYKIIMDDYAPKNNTQRFQIYLYDKYGRVLEILFPRVLAIDCKTIVIDDIWSTILGNPKNYSYYNIFRVVVKREDNVWINCRNK